ncbi:DUF899 family protein [Balneolaceae bacterium YR4-1]|uniref:DUF899 family protein n=1 Tax=Halalkalibaculum roseum TaxID=2709311 RepID=A0A6M1T2I8_9BACT|nr:DUF899 family protein [Halalkalibaculum roseum]NGP76977.1 DUF899 family protein [Halalkalibaculum roseum]
MGEFHDKSFPGESAEYRKKRDRLLQAEIELRRQIERVAEQRRALPVGGPVKVDYVFQEGASELTDRETRRDVRISELFEDGKQSLFIYSFMYHPDSEVPCTSCNSVLDGLNGQAPHIADRVNFAVVAKAPIQKIRSWALKRGWNNLRMLSSYKNNYNLDYFGESPDGSQWPAVNVFRKTRDGIFHFYNTELLYAPSEKGQNPRHVDLIWPLWNVFDMTPEGRGTDWYPRFEYEE